MRIRKALPPVNIDKEDIIRRINERGRLRIIRKQAMVDFLKTFLRLNVDNKQSKKEIYQILISNLNVQTFDLYCEYDNLFQGMHNRMRLCY